MTYFDISSVCFLSAKENGEIEKLKLNISKKFNTTEALKWKPHISVAERVLIPKNKIDDLIDKIERICQEITPFKVKTDKFYFGKVKSPLFKNKNIISLNVVKSKDLIRLSNEIQKLYTNLEKPSMKWKKYNPHVTIAYRDMTEDNFRKAKKYTINNDIDFTYKFYLNELSLVEYRNNKCHIFKRYKFNK